MSEGKMKHGSCGWAVSACLLAAAGSVFAAAPLGERYRALWNDEVNAAIDRRIECYRKADCTVRGFRPGSVVKVEQVTSEFQFGANMFLFDQLGSDEMNRRYRAAFGEIFNAATIPFYWKEFEPERGLERFSVRTAADSAAFWNAFDFAHDDPYGHVEYRRPAPESLMAYCEANGIAMHGHALVYMAFIPAWLNDAKWSRNEMEDLLAGHIRSIAGKCRGRIGQWDVVNEATGRDGSCTPSTPNDDVSWYVRNGRIRCPLPKDYTFKSFKRAAEAFPPDVKLCLNDAWPTNQCYAPFAKRLVDRGAKIDVVGLQKHVFKPAQLLSIAKGETDVIPSGTAWAPATQIAQLAELDRTRRPIHISEITIPSPRGLEGLSDDEADAIQARVLTDQYRLWFSWPSVYRITYWNLVDGTGAKNEIMSSGFFNRDMSEKAAAKAIRKLVRETWRTNLELTADKSGAVSFRGFRGRYRITGTDCAGRACVKEVTVAGAAPALVQVGLTDSTLAPAEWSVGEVNGAPGLLRKGTPVAPVLFWQWELEERDVRDLSSAGLELFSCFGSFPHYAHPYWTPQGFGGMDYQDALLDKLLTWNPQASFLPRLFYSAPNWWVKSHPDELVRYTNPNVLTAVDAERNHSGAVPRESFASERFRAEAGPVYRKAVRHLMDRYGDHLMGIHLTSGPWGEHFAWDALTQLGGTPLAKAGFSDASRPMTERFRRYLRTKYGADLARLRDAWKDGDVTFESAEVPSAEARNRLDADGVWRDPAKGRQVPDYFECMNLVTVEMLDTFAKAVKDESKGTLPTLAFYGYTQDEHWSLECDHRAIAAAYRSPNLDMFSAPHTYHRRSPGEDGVSRCYLASAALHGKLFIDEGDDMTHLEQLKSSPDPRCSATNMFESLNILYREFGMTVTHGTGLWYMDLKRDTFRHPELVAAVGRMRRAAGEALRRDRSHRSEVAVVSNVESEFYMGYRRTEANNVSQFLYQQQLGAFYRAGAPFDWYLADDLDAVVRRGYKTVVFLDCQYLTDKQKTAVDSLKSKGRTLVFFHAPGYVSPVGLSRMRMEATCGVRMRPETVRGVLSAVDVQTGREWGCGLDRVVDGVEDRPRGVRHRKPGTAQRGLFLPAGGETLMTGVGNLKDVPVAVRVRHADWTGVFSALPALAPDVLRRLYRAAGVHVYTDADVVLSANGAWVMVHTRMAGDVTVRLPKKSARVTDVTSGRVVAERTDEVMLPLAKFQTAVLMLD